MRKLLSNTLTEFHLKYKTQIHKSGICQSVAENHFLSRKKLNEHYRDDQSIGEPPAQGWAKHRVIQLRLLVLLYYGPT